MGEGRRIRGSGEGDGQEAPPELGARGVKMASPAALDAWLREEGIFYNHNEAFDGSFLVENYTSGGWSSMDCAAAAGRIDILMALLEHGRGRGMINAANISERGQAPLIFASGNSCAAFDAPPMAPCNWRGTDLSSKVLKHRIVCDN